LNQFKGLRNVLVGYSAVAANLGGIPLAFAFVASLGMQGLYTKLLSVIGINLSDLGFKISDFSGIVIVYLYFQIPLMTLVMLPAVDGLKVTLKEAAASVGATPRQYWRSIGIPLLSPSLLGGFLLLLRMHFLLTQPHTRFQLVDQILFRCRFVFICKEIPSPENRTWAMR